MRFIKFSIVLLLSIAITGCTSKDFFFGDYYNAGLDKNNCYYNKDNVLFASRNGKCSFYADTLVGMRSNKESYIVLFSSLGTGTGTGYSALYDIDKQNVDELASIFIEFYKWSKLPEDERLAKASRLNNELRTKTNLATLGVPVEYTYINKIQPEMNFKEYNDTPLLMLNYHDSTYGVPDNRYWLFTSEGALKFAVMIKRTSQLLK